MSDGERQELTSDEYSEVTDTWIERLNNAMGTAGCNDVCADEFPASVVGRFHSDLDVMRAWCNAWDRHDNELFRLRSELSGAREWATGQAGKIAALKALAGTLEKQLRIARSAINTMEEDALGTSWVGEESWPIKVEVLADIDAALSEARGLLPKEEDDATVGGDGTRSEDVGSARSVRGIAAAVAHGHVGGVVAAPVGRKPSRGPVVPVSGNDKRAREWFLAAFRNLLPEHLDDHKAAWPEKVVFLTSLLDSVESEGRKRGIEEAAEALKLHVVCRCYAVLGHGPGVVGQEHWGNCIAKLYEDILALASKEETNE